MLLHLLTIINASHNERCVFTNCSAPPRKIIVAVFNSLHSVKKLYLSYQLFFFKFTNSPNISLFKSPKEACITALLHYIHVSMHHQVLFRTKNHDLQNIGLLNHQWLTDNITFAPDAQLF